MISTKLPFALVWAAMMIGLTSSGDVMVKRSDDSDPYAAVIDQHAQTLQNLQARLQAVENRLGQREWFRAVLSKAVTANAPIHFDLDFSLGSGHYSPTTGIYTVGTPGVYLVGFQLFPNDMTDILMDLYVEGAIKVRSRCYDSVSYPSSCTGSTVLRLKGGDRLWVQSTHSGLYFPDAHSFFYGALLSPDP